LKARTWDRILLTATEFGLSPEEVAKLPWVAERVATVSPVRTGVEIRVGPYAGSLYVRPGLILEVEELVPGTVAACLNLSRSGRRQAPQRGGGPRRIEPTLAVAEMFVTTCTEFIRSGPLKEYVRRHETVARPRGRIDVAGTVRGPMARGNRSAVVCDWRQLTEDTPLNRLLLSAAVRAERILREHGEDSRLARILIISMAGAQFVPNPSTSVHLSTRDAGETVGLATALIEGVPLALSPEPSDQPVTAWINVERIFEEAVFELCRRNVGDATVTRGQDDGVMLFHSKDAEPEALQKSAEPDVVVTARGGQRVILDAKYRRSGEEPDDSELYQLIAHAVAYSATAAALVTPALFSPSTVRRLGRIRTGCVVDVVSVDPASATSIKQGIQTWMAANGVRPASTSTELLNLDVSWAPPSGLSAIHETGGVIDDPRFTRSNGPVVPPLPAEGRD
jgi:McrBC 5-methylcytosine restriction system component